MGPRRIRKSGDSVALAAVLLAVMAAQGGCLAGNAEATGRRLRRDTEALCRGIDDPRLRARHEGMMLYLADRIGRADLSDEKARAAFDERVAQWQGIRDALKAGADLLGQKRGRFEWAYQSGADGSGQPMTLDVPEDYDGRSRMPLVVALHGLGGDHRYGISEDGAPAHILLSVNGRASAFYRGLGELDVLEATRFVRSQYNVDRNRVFVLGSSMGGWGVLRMTTRHPDAYAAGVDFCGWATGLDMGNLSHTPIQLHHGDADFSVHVGFKRLAVQRLGEPGKLFRYYEYPGVGHGVVGPAGKNDPLAFLLSKEFDPLPRRLRYTTDQVTRGRCRWLGIERLLDAGLAGTVSLAAEPAAVRGQTTNVAVLHLGQLQTLFVGRENVRIILDDQEMVLRPVPEEVWLVTDGRRWELEPEDAREARKAKLVYQRGGFFNIYDGQPIRIVAPAGWRENEEQKRLITRCSTTADMFASWPMRPYGAIPIVEADEFDPGEFEGHLIVVGRGEDNRALADLLAHLPARIRGKELVVDGVGRYPADSTAMSLTYYNPRAPKCRLVWLLNATAETFPCLPLLARYEHVSYHPDIVLHDCSDEEPVIVAAANFGNEWSSPLAEQEEPLLPELIECHEDLARALAAIYLRALGADFAVYESAPERWRGWDRLLAAGRLTLSSLKALMPPGSRPIVRARLVRSKLEQLFSLKQLMEEDRFGILSAAGPPLAKAQYDVVFCEPVIWRFRRLRFSFPRGSLAYAGKDAFDYLGILTQPGSAAAIGKTQPIEVDRFVDVTRLARKRPEDVDPKCTNGWQPVYGSVRQVQTFKVAGGLKLDSVRFRAARTVERPAGELTVELHDPSAAEKKPLASGSLRTEWTDPEGRSRGVTRDFRWVVLPMPGDLRAGGTYELVFTSPGSDRAGPWLVNCFYRNTFAAGEHRQLEAGRGARKLGSFDLVFELAGGGATRLTSVPEAEDLSGNEPFGLGHDGTDLWGVLPRPRP